MGQKGQQMSHPEVDHWEKRLAHGDVLANDAPVSMEYSKQNVRKKHIFQFHFGYIVWEKDLFSIKGKKKREENKLMKINNRYLSYHQ